MVFRYLQKLRRHARDVTDYLRAFKRREHTDFKVIKVDSQDYLLAAKKLHARVYLDRGFVNSTDVVNDILGSHIDPYPPHSQYFVVVDKRSGRLVATARQIQAKRHKGHYSFAMFKNTPLYKRSRRLIRTQKPLDCVEISGLAKHRGTSKIAPLLLYRTMWQYSLENKHELWLLAVDVTLFHRLKLLFGPAIQKAGPITFYMGSNVVPAVLKVQRSVRALEKSLQQASFYQRPLRKRIARFFLKNIPLDMLSPAERAALKRLNLAYGIGPSIVEARAAKVTA